MSLKNPSQQADTTDLAAEEWNQGVKLSLYEQETLIRLERAWKKHYRVLMRLPSTEEVEHVVTEAIRRELPKAKGERFSVLIVGTTEIGKLKGNTFLYISQATLLKELQTSRLGYKPNVVIINNARMMEENLSEALIKKWPKTKMIGLTRDTNLHFSVYSYYKLFETGLLSWDVQKEDIDEKKYVFLTRGISLQPDMEVYAEDHLIGIKQHQRTVRQPRFSRIDLFADSDYFAIATSNTKRGRIRTLIANDGTTQDTDISSPIGEIGNGIFFYNIHTGNHTFPIAKKYWDAIRNNKYNSIPRVVTIGGVECVGEEMGMLQPRYLKEGVKQYLRRREIRYNDHITLIIDYLVINSQPKVAYKVYGYRNDQIIVYAPRSMGYLLVGLDGTTSKLRNFDKDCHKQAEVGEMFREHLKRADDHNK